MSRWFRHYAGMMRDEKLVRAAVASKQPVERVVWIWGALLESAAEINAGGRYELDAGEVAYFLRCETDDVDVVLACLESLGRIVEGSIARWGDRQFDSDASRERQRRYRERRANAGSPECDGDVELPESDVTPPSPDAGVTLQDTRDRDIDREKKEQDAHIAREFDCEFWPAYPHHVQRKPALAAFRKARKRETLETIMDGLRRYVRTKPPDRHWLNPATFLNQERWNDEPEPNQQHAAPRKQSQLDRVFGALAEIGAGLDDPGRGQLDSPPGTEPNAADGGSEFGDFVEVAPRLRAV